MEEIDNRLADNDVINIGGDNDASTSSQYAQQSFAVSFSKFLMNI